MICSTTLCMGSFAVERATSEEAIRAAIDRTNVIETLMDEVLRENTVNMGGAYGAAAKVLMQTDPMKDYVAAYMTYAISSQIYGKDVEEVAYDELTAAFEDGIAIAEKEKNFSLTTSEYELIRQEMERTIPALTAKLNDALDRYQTTALNEEMQQRIRDVQLIVSPGFRYGSMGISILTAILLIVLFWGSRLGFIWASVNVLLASCAYGVVALVSNSFADQSGVLVDPIKRMLYIMCEYGSVKIAIAGGITGVVLIIICAIMRALRRY